MSDWHEITVGELGKIFDGPHATPTRIDEGPFFLNIASLNQGRLDLQQSDHVSEEDFSRWTKRVTPRGGDLLFSYETRLGEAALMPNDIRACLGRRMALIRPNTDVVDSRFLLYLYLSAEFQETIERNTIHGATVNRVPLNRMAAWPVKIPEIREQRAIADVLGALDDKIAANTALCAAADQLVRAEYSSLTGGLWVRVGDVALSPRDGVNPSTLHPSTAYVGLEHIPRRTMWLADSGTAGDITSGKSRFEEGDILFGKLRPYFHKVVTAPIAGICSTDVLVVRAKEHSLATVLLAAVSSDEVIDSVVAASEGTRMPRTSWKDLAATQIKWPTAEQARPLETRLSSIRSSVQGLLVENRTLTATRDALLPQLMSGRLRVGDAEAAASGAGV